MHFEKVSYEQWEKDCLKFNPNMTVIDCCTAYDMIQLPDSSTASSAGHDFHIPFDVKFIPGEKKLIPTGIRWITQGGADNHTVLIICPRSGLGTKFGMRLNNTIGIIDADYCQADNEGHIMAMIEVDKECELYMNDKFIQGVIIPFIHCGNESTNQRTGGFGSTGE